MLSNGGEEVGVSITVVTVSVSVVGVVLSNGGGEVGVSITLVIVFLSAVSVVPSSGGGEVGVNILVAGGAEDGEHPAVITETNIKSATTSHHGWPRRKQSGRKGFILRYSPVGVSSLIWLGSSIDEEGVKSLGLAPKSA